MRSLVAVVLLLPTFMFAQDRSHARSMVVTTYGIVATSHVQASLGWRADPRAGGGSAIDAAIAANATLGVTEPMMNGIGGDLFAIYWDAKAGKLYGLNSSGWAPQGLTVDRLKIKGESPRCPTKARGESPCLEQSPYGMLCTIRFGKLPWKDLFAPALFYAQNGYPVPELISQLLGRSPSRYLAHDPEGQRVYLPNGKPPALGAIFRNPDLANLFDSSPTTDPQRSTKDKSRKPFSPHRKR